MKDNMFTPEILTLDQIKPGKYKILVDVDEVKVKWIDGFLLWYNEKYKTNYKKEDIWTFDLWQVFGKSQEESDKDVLDFYDTELFKELDAYDGVESFLKKVNGVGLSATARPDSTLNATLYNLGLRFGKNVLPIIFAKPFSSELGRKDIIYPSKAEIVQKGKIPYAIEDSIRQTMSLIPYCKKIFLVNVSYNSTPEARKQLEDYEKSGKVQRINRLDEIPYDLIFSE